MTEETPTGDMPETQKTNTPDDTPSEAASDAAEATAPDPDSAGGNDTGPTALAEQLDAAKKKADEHWDAVLRLQAELENLRKRAARDVENAHKYGLERLVSELLPVCDSMEMGASAADSEGIDVAKVQEGIELTLKMLRTAMEKFGVEVVDPAGERFDPERHQAMTMEETDAVGSGDVVRVFQKGYLLNGRLVRPAMVVVAK